ncbi:tetratricopeptide repeat protein [Gracilinema caldarium]|uniref:Tetratricopeptide TPR_2 repeat-containing protein n=1 Tax=Gracilinema caldarium (strain ATCC 51460 / DSM 7334 / H1) TaxID=744872 RepID=F8F3G0_GRAC1|nr:tetratricopeptide repeat protein [Gracilinema caldarium]AEJ19536.1 Tetratricopeptide TPR_2 repeat-containing protein [Gracilinema caldarium DSM 7334]
MFSHPRSSYSASILKKRIIKKSILGVMLLVITFLTIVIIRNHHLQQINNRDYLLSLWNNGRYEDVLQRVKSDLQKKPLDTFLLIMYGFSAFQVAESQTAPQDAQVYYDDCISSLRKVLLYKSKSKDGRIPYVLGKAYFKSGPAYADSAILYLEKAKKLGYSAPDLYEYLGLAYASVKDYRNSVVAFSEALQPEKDPSDVLLLAIATSYIGLSDYDNAKAYLYRCIESTKDDDLRSKARLSLASLFVSEGKQQEAMDQYLAIIANNDQNAEAHFQLGELYANFGDAIKARSEWRKTLKIDPNHGPARNRLSM